MKLGKILGIILFNIIAFSSVFAQDKKLTEYMETSTFTVIYTIMFLLISVLLGVWASKKAKTAEGFFGGTKSFGPITIGLASMAALMSAFGFVGGPGLVYKLGFSSIWMTIACGPGFAYAYWILGKRMRAMAEVTSVATLPDIARVRYQCNAIRAIFAFGLLIAAIAYLSSQMKGAAMTLAQMLGVSETWAIVIFMGVMLIFLLKAGMAASIVTDAFQGLIMLIGVFAVVIGFFILTKGDAMVSIAQAQNLGTKYVDGIGAAPLQTIITFTIVFFVFVMSQSTMLSKMYTVKSYKGLKQAGLLSGVTYAMASLVWILVGYGALYLLAQGRIEPLQKADNAAFVFLNALESPIISTLVMASLFAATISTASYFLTLASSSITRDILGSFGVELSQEKQIAWGRVIMILIALLSIGFAYWGTDMVAILGTIGWGFFASVNFPTLTLGLLWKRTSREGVLTGIILAILLNILLPILDRTGIYKLPFPYYTLSIVVSISATVFVSLFTKGSAGDNLPEPIKPIFKL
ncbi:MAG TPA: sodium:proline symporter [Spirochaetota bacterium]|nr:sodium:proline symporter [Spirochaetota bacterium]HOM37791.1 sodium:proline symporter [Spirochaetota bacterium]HPQ49332.1 sodium:proline symporter [Spirochaetota bacterium]